MARSTKSNKGTPAQIKFKHWLGWKQVVVRMAPYYIYDDQDAWSLFCGDRLPAREGKSEEYRFKIWMAWCEGETWHKYNHQTLYMLAAMQLGWHKTGRPDNERLVILYGSSNASWLNFVYPHGVLGQLGGCHIHIQREIKWQE